MKFGRKENSLRLVFSFISLCGFICIASLLLPHFFSLDNGGRKKGLGQGKWIYRDLHKFQPGGTFCLTGIN